MPNFLTPDEFEKRYPGALIGQSADGSTAPPISPAPGQTLTADEFARRYPAVQMTNPEVPAPTLSTPTPQPTVARGSTVSNYTDADREANTQQVWDFARYFSQNATFNYSDEAIAAVRAAIGEDLAAALADEREKLAGATERLGAGDKALAIGASMLVPMGPIAKVIQRLAGAGAGAMKTAAASGVVMAPVGGLGAVGAMEDKSDIGSDAAEFTKGAALTGVASTGLGTVAALVPGASKLVLEAPKRVAEWLHARGSSSVPLRLTTDYAVKEIANAAELGGIRTTSDLASALQKNSVPNTPSALVNTNSDRLFDLAGDSAARLNQPNVLRIENGKETRSNVWEALIRNQQKNSSDATQGEAFRTRLFDSHGVPNADRSMHRIHSENAERLKRGGERLNTLASTPAGKSFAATRVKGFADLFDQHEPFRRLYREASQRVSIPGSSDTIAADAIPLIGDDYDRAVDAFRSGARSTTPLRLSDDNIPVPVLEAMDAEASRLAGEGVGRERDLGRRMMQATRPAMEALAKTRSRAGQIVATKRAMHDVHAREEAFKLGFHLPTQETLPRAQSAVAIANLPTTQRDTAALGMLHGIADLTKKNEADLGSVREKLFANPDVVDAYNRVGRHGKARGATAKQLGNELQNIGNMQDVAQALRSLSRNRSEAEPVTVQAARAYSNLQYRPTPATAWLAYRWYQGKTQPRIAETARLLTDTTGEGHRLLAAELTRRNAAKQALPSWGRIVVLNEIARQLGNQQSQ